MGGVDAVEAEAIGAAASPTVDDVAGAAVVADPAVAYRNNAHAVAGLDEARLVHCDDDASALVAGNERLFARPLIQAVEVGAADGRGLELHHHLLTFGHRVGPVPGLHLVRIQNLRSTHGSSPSRSGKPPARRNIATDRKREECGYSKEVYCADRGPRKTSLRFGEKAVHYGVVFESRPPPGARPGQESRLPRATPPVGLIPARGWRRGTWGRPPWLNRSRPRRRPRNFLSSSARTARRGQRRSRGQPWCGTRTRHGSRRRRRTFRRRPSRRG